MLGRGQGDHERGFEPPGSLGSLPARRFGLSGPAGAKARADACGHAGRRRGCRAPGPCRRDVLVGVALATPARVLFRRDRLSRSSCPPAGLPGRDPARGTGRPHPQAPSGVPGLPGGDAAHGSAAGVGEVRRHSGVYLRTLPCPQGAGGKTCPGGVLRTALRRADVLAMASRFRRGRCLGRRRLARSIRRRVWRTAGNRALWPLHPAGRRNAPCGNHNVSR